jgi:hypothetical protein
LYGACGTHVHAKISRPGRLRGAAYCDGMSSIAMKRRWARVDHADCLGRLCFVPGVGE